MTDKPAKPVTFARLLDRATRILAMRDHSEAEFRRKIMQNSRALRCAMKSRLKILRSCWSNSSHGVMNISGWTMCVSPSVLSSAAAVKGMARSASAWN